MKIIKGVDRGGKDLTARKLVELVEDGTVNFDIDIQRGYVWRDNDKKSAFIRSLILDRHVPPLYFNKMEWFVTFFCGKKSPTTSKGYNDAAGRGTGKNSAVKKRMEEIRKSYDSYFVNIRN